MTNARLKTEALRSLVRDERNASADIILALIEFDRDRLWMELGYNCLFTFLRRELGYSKGAASYRNCAARLVRKYPQVIEPLRSGQLCLSVVTELGRVITSENIGEVMPRFFGLSKLEAKMLVAELAPRTVVPRRDVITSARTGHVIRTEELRTLKRDEVHPGEPLFLPKLADVPPAEVHPGEPPSLAIPAQSTEAIRQSELQDEFEPMTGHELRMHVTISVDFYKKLERARAALAHKHPDASTETILSEGLDLVLKDHAKRKGLVERPRKVSKTPGSNAHIPAAEQRKVWERDEGKCQFPIESGGICGSERRIEFDHFPVPKALGGPSTAENLRLTCRFHNLEAAKRTYGAEWMSQFLDGHSQEKR